MGKEFCRGSYIQSTKKSSIELKKPHKCTDFRTDILEKIVMQKKEIIMDIELNEKYLQS